MSTKITEVPVEPKEQRLWLAGCIERGLATPKAIEDRGTYFEDAGDHVFADALGLALIGKTGGLWEARFALYDAGTFDSEKEDDLRKALGISSALFYELSLQHGNGVPASQIIAWLRAP